MISWRSYTTSELLPTFSGDWTQSFSAKNSNGITLSSWSLSPTGEISQGDKATYTKNSSFYESPPYTDPIITEIAPPATRQQQTTTFVDTTRIFYTTTANSGYYEDEESEIFIPFQSQIWTTTIESESTLFTEIYADTTSQVTTTIEKDTTKKETTTIGPTLSFIVYPHRGLNKGVSVIENTIYEYTPFERAIQNELFGEGGETFFASINATQNIPFSSAVFLPARTTVFYSEEIISTLPKQNETVTKTQSESTTTYLLSGQPTISFSENGTLYGNRVFPWTSRTFRRSYTLTNPATTLRTSSSIEISFETTQETQNAFNRETLIGAGGFTSTGDFFSIIRGAETTVEGANISQVRLIKCPIAFPLAVASPELTFDTKNTHSTVGGGMSANNEFSWNIITQGSISRGVANALPLYPTFTAVSSSKDGSMLSESTDYTSLTGQYEGPTFTTTAQWKSKNGSETENLSSSGTFSITTLNSFNLGFSEDRDNRQKIIGGFLTPHASRRSFIPPGVYLFTTFDELTSGTDSSFLSTGTTGFFEGSGVIPVSVISRMALVRGYGVITQSLLDNGMP